MGYLILLSAFMAICVFLSIRARIYIDRSKAFDSLASSFLNLHFKAIGFQGKATVVRGRAEIIREDAA